MALRSRRLARRARKILTVVAVLTTAAVLGLPQSAQAKKPQAKPSASVVGFGSQLKINGKSYAMDAKTKEFKPISPKSTALGPSTFPPSGYHTFTRAAPFWSFADLNGDGYQQVSYATNTEQWAYTISSAVQGLVVGNVTQIADLWHGSTRTHFGQHIVPADYFFHGSSQNVSHSGTYAVTFRATFRCNVGASCTGELDAKWTWLYSNR